MDFSFLDALNSIGGSRTVLRIANATRPAEMYLYSNLLPEVIDSDYEASSSSMIIRTTMAGIVGADAPFPPSGAVETDEWRENTLKVANHPYLTELALRKIQLMLKDRYVQSGGQVDNAFIVQEALNFLQKIVLQAHVDTFEWMRGQALCNGAIDWTFNGKRVQVDYRLNPNNIMPTASGAYAYGGTQSVFWQHVRQMRAALRYNVRDNVFMMHPDLWDVTVSNPVNNIHINEGSTVLAGTFNVTKYINQNGVNTPSTDARDTINVVLYGLEGEIYDQFNPGKTVRVPFHNRGTMLAVSPNERNEYRVGEGSTDDPRLSLGLGFTHIGPTVEGGSRPGRWARLYVPEGRPMQIHGEGVTNGLPVIEVPEKIAIGRSDVPAYNPYEYQYAG